MPRVLDRNAVFYRLSLAGYEELFEFQLKAVSAFEREKDVLIKAPTGAGKTVVPQMWITYILGLKQRCVFLVPTRRLIDQTYNRLIEWFDKIPRYRKRRIVILTGENRPSHKIIKRADVIITTFESFNGLLMRNFEYTLLKNVGLIVVDEMHMIGDPKRGGRLEDVIVKATSWLRPRPRMLYLTALIKNVDEVADWLGAELIETDERHSEIIVNTTCVFDEARCMRTIATLVKETYEVDVTANQAKARCVLVFCAKRKSAEARAAKLKQIFKTEGYKLAISYSHSGLSATERIRRMKEFQDGEINVLFTTTEYKEGISAPVLRVIIADADAMIYSPQDLESMVGRTARPEFYDIGYADLLVRKDVDTFYDEKRIKVTQKGIEFKEERLRSWARFYLRDLILHRISRGAVSSGSLLNHLKRFYMHYDDRTLIKTWTEVLETELYQQQNFTIRKSNMRKFLSLLNDNDNYDDIEKEEYKQFVTDFLTQSYDTIVKQNRNNEVWKRKTAFFLEILYRHRNKALARCDKKLKTDVKLHLRELMSYELVQRKGGKYRVTDIGRWTSQFLLPAVIGAEIHRYFNEQRFPIQGEAAYWKITEQIAKHVQQITGKYSRDHYIHFIKAIAEDLDVETAASRVKMWLGDAEDSRRTAAWIAESVHAYVGAYNPLFVDAARDISASLSVMKKGEFGPKSRRYLTEKPLPHQNLDTLICSLLKHGRITTYKQLHEDVCAQYDRKVGLSTIIWNVLNMGAKEKIKRFPKGRGVGRPVSQVCDQETEIPLYMLKTCGSCVFRMKCPSENDKERDDQRFICELGDTYNKYVGRKVVTTDVTRKQTACRFYDNSRKRDSRTFAYFKRMDDGTPICCICKKAEFKEPDSYSQYTICPNCNSIYRLRHNGKIVVEPGTRDLLQTAMESILKRSIKPVKMVKQTEGYLRRQEIWLTVREGDEITINQDMLYFVAADGRTLKCRIDAIRRIKVIGEIKLSMFVRNKLKGRIMHGEDRDDSKRVPFEGYKPPNDQTVSDTLKQRADFIRERKDGLLLAWQLVMSKKASNAHIAMRAVKDGLLDPADADELFSAQLNAVAHTVIYWTGNRDNLMGLEAWGEKLAWEIYKRILEDSPMRYRSRTYDRYVPSSLFMGKVKARSPFSAGINALKKHLLNKCQRILWNVGFSWFPGELSLHYRRGEGQRIGIGVVLDFREMFLPMFRYAYVKACKTGEITNDDFNLEYTTNLQEVYTLKRSAEEKIWILFDDLMNEVVYYDHEYMTLRDAMNRCASYLAGFLLEETPFIPFVCVSDEGEFHEIYTIFRSIDRFCAPLGKDPPVPMTRLLT